MIPDDFDNNVHGWNGISVRMILICDSSVLVTPLKIIFQTVRKMEYSRKYEKWKILFLLIKKSSKQLIKSYKSVSLLPVFGKMSDKVIYSSISMNNLNKMGFFQLSNYVLDQVTRL